MQSLQIAHLTPCTEAEGPGKRFAIWFQGCPLRCPGCCNPEFLSFTGGQAKSLAELSELIHQSRMQNAIEGITLLGGEPFAHLEGSLALASVCRDSGLSVMVFTGYTLEELQSRNSQQIQSLLDLCDIIVDGRYDRDQPDTERRWIGSRNQRIHFLTNRYSFDSHWVKRNTLEIRLVGRDLSINGFPSGQAAGLWKGWKRRGIPKSAE